jgi:UDP-2,3-diacylglucosamine pyrophosphatase LpxH
MEGGNMQKNQFPILDFDENRDPMINPTFMSRYTEGKIKCDKLIICFFKAVIDRLIEKQKIERYLTINSENPYSFYRFVDSNILLVHGVAGGPLCGGILEEAIALGVNKIMFCGGAGTLVKEVTLGKLVVINSAIRQEGTSYHYVSPSREIEADKSAVKVITDYLKTIQADFVVGKTWTTDAFYRETKDLVEIRRSEGAILVEMEQASLLAISQFRKVKYGAILYGGDDLSKPAWDGRIGLSRDEIRENLLILCKDIVTEF